jgi:hypothetical protein
MRFKIFPDAGGDYKYALPNGRAPDGHATGLVRACEAVLKCVFDVSECVLDLFV